MRAARGIFFGLTTMATNPTANKQSSQEPAPEEVVKEGSGEEKSPGQKEKGSGQEENPGQEKGQVEKEGIKTSRTGIDLQSSGSGGTSGPSQSGGSPIGRCEAQGISVSGYPNGPCRAQGEKPAHPAVCQAPTASTA